ncbi:MAG TPA: MFS transporter [Pseudonocardia sp.]|jgi:AAHS family 4-hydroxybenzoate transporter-like MFS transporter|nr:MFS transporter [Pseudonocardia sp.]
MNAGASSPAGTGPGTQPGTSGSDTQPDTGAGARVEPSRVRWGLVVLAFLAVLLDGFDSAALAVVVPTLSREWHVTAAGFTLPLVLTNIGVVLGYLSSGWLGARWGRRRLLIGGVVLFAAATCAVAALLGLRSIPLLTALRVLTGVGLGAVLPAAVSLSTEHSPTRRRELVAVVVTLGLTSGGTLGGFFGGRLLLGLGADGVFWVAGLLPLVLVVALVRWVPRTSAAAPAHAEAAREEARLGRLFTPELRTNTTLLWTFAFLVFVAAYTLTSWTPTLLTGYGFSPSRAPLGLAFVSFGGLLGGLALIPLAARIGIARALVLMPTLGVVCMVVAARADLGDTALLLALGGAGAGLVAGQIGQLTMAVSLYSVGARTTGIGWVSALGRAGSIVGPAIAGVLIAFALAGKDIVLLTAIPVLVAAGCALVLARRTRRGARS